MNDPLLREASGYTIAIVGGGFTGTTLAAQLLQHSTNSLSVVLIEVGGYPGRGVAYGTPNGWHLLNVEAGRMSALDDQPEHFMRWAQANYNSAIGSQSFLPRRVYGHYIAALLLDAAAMQPGRFSFKHDEAVSIDAEGKRGVVWLRSGDAVVADKIVLALGNFPPGDPNLPGKPVYSARYVPNAWSSSALPDVAQDREILLLGSGLTAIDQVLALRAAEFRETIHILSRHGLLPQPHKFTSPWRAFCQEGHLRQLLLAGSPRTARGLLRLVLDEVRAAQRIGSDWRAVIDSLRPHTQSIWQSLPASEQRRFLRHLRPYWEIHRHRVAPEIGHLIAHELIAGKLQIHAGRVTKYEDCADGVAITYRGRATAESVKLFVSRVINCTGPETDCRKCDSPLLENLQRSGRICPDRLYLGLEVDENGALVDGSGVPSDFLYAIGPQRKGALWETTAVPEIRKQAAELVRLLMFNSDASHINANDPANYAATYV